jgi:hypothetical protein
MTILQHAVRYGQLRLGRRLSRSLPWVGAAIALMAVGTAIRRKGIVGGTVDTALNALPVVGAAKNVAEAFRGRDFIPDRIRTRDAGLTVQDPTASRPDSQA